jgi:hypothetical protein
MEHIKARSRELVEKRKRKKKERKGWDYQSWLLMMHKVSYYCE